MSCTEFYLTCSSIVVTLLLGIAALVIASKSNKLSKETIKLNDITIKLTRESTNHEKKMRALEVNIATYNEIFKVYNFFTSELFDPIFFDFDDLFSNFNNNFTRLTELGFKINFLFEKNIASKLMQKIYSIQEVLLNKRFPDYDINEIDNNIKVTLDANETLNKKKIFLNQINEDIFEIFEPYKLNL